MEVDFTPDQKVFIRQAIESGRIHRPEDAAYEAFSLWVERERYALAHRFARRYHDKARAQGAAARMLKRREQHALPEGMTIRSMIDEGRN